MIYDKEYLKNTLSIIKDNFEDLATWSVNNGDKEIDSISFIQQAINDLSKHLLKEKA